MKQQLNALFAPLLTLTAIAERTTTLKVCTALLVVPFRNPVVLAKEIATLDQLSGGRSPHRSVPGEGPCSGPSGEDRGVLIPLIKKHLRPGRFRDGGVF